MTFDFDALIDRRGTDNVKWSMYEPDVLPMFVADMDFRSPEPVIRVLHERIDQGTFGYEFDLKELRAILCERMRHLYNWHVEPEHIVFSPGLVTALNTVARAVGHPGDGALMTGPIYPPFLSAPASNARFANVVDMTAIKNGHLIHYEIDFDAFEGAITPQTRLFSLCNPHNPVGRVYRPDELGRMADICLKHNMIICSDEIHCDLLFAGQRHVPIAALSPEIAEQTVTLMAPSKTFNMPGLHCGFMIVQNKTLRQQIQTAGEIAGSLSTLGYPAAIAAYREGQPWLDALLVYLQGNRDFLVKYVQEHFPEAATTCPQGTYLAWLDFRAAKIPGNVFEFFLKEARVALGQGENFGRAGEGFVRLNFGCPRSMLQDGLDRMRSALEHLK